MIQLLSQETGEVFFESNNLNIKDVFLASDRHPTPDPQEYEEDAFVVELGALICKHQERRGGMNLRETIGALLRIATCLRMKGQKETAEEAHEQVSAHLEVVAKEHQRNEAAGSHLKLGRWLAMNPERRLIVGGGK